MNQTQIESPLAQAAQLLLAEVTLPEGPEKDAKLVEMAKDLQERRGG